MTAYPQERPLPQPQSKALPTVQSSYPDIVATKAGPVSRPPSRARATKPKPDVSTKDFTSNHATQSLIRRTLIRDNPQHAEAQSTPIPIEGALPPLTSSNQIDLQLYALIAIVIKDFVNTWYSKITPDHSFVDEIIQILAHCSRALEERVRKTDIVELILDKIPSILEQHIHAYRTAASSLAQHSFGVDPIIAYHSLNPHPALEPVPDANKPETYIIQSQSEAAYRQILVNGALAILLPTEDLQNAPLRILVTDIIADLILGQALSEKICEGWFIHDAIAKAITVLKDVVEPKASGEQLRIQTKSRLDQFGLLNTKNENKSALQSLDESKLARWFWRIMQWAYLVVTAVWSIMQGLLQARHLPKRYHLPLSSTSSGSLKSSSTPTIADDCGPSPRPVLAYRISNFVSDLIRLQERMPWLSGTIIFWQHVLLYGSGRLGATNSVFDRFLYHNLSTHVFTPKLVVSVLTSLRGALFPNNSPGPPAPPAPSLEEQLIIRRRAAEAILSLLPFTLLQHYFNGENEDHVLKQIEEDILDVFGDKYMNKHWIYGTLELFLVRLMPELRDSGVGELMEERGITWDGNNTTDEAKVTAATSKSEKMVTDQDLR